MCLKPQVYIPMSTISIFLTKAISLSSMKITFDPFLVILFLWKGEKKGLTEVSGPKLSSYKTINNPIELCIFSLATVSLSANVVSKYMHAPCKVKIHHHGCFWMYFTCFSSGRRIGPKLPTLNSFTWSFRKEKKNIPLISSNYARLCLKNYILDFSCNILFSFGSNLSWRTL